MNILLIINESGTRPSGVVNVVKNKVAFWGAEDSITILSNKNCQINSSKLIKDWKSINSRLSFESKWSPTDVNYKFKLIQIFIRPLLNFYSIFVLIPWLKSKKFDAIISHCGGWPTAGLNRSIIFSSWLTGISKRILVIHNYPKKYPKLLSFVYLFYSKIYEIFSTNVVTVSESCRKSLIRVAGFSDPKVIYNGIEKIDNAAYKKEIVWKNGKTSIGFVGEIHPRKGIHLLLESMKRITSPCNLVIIGSGYNVTYQNKLNSISRELIHEVFFLGFRNDAIELYNYLDILVLPSISYESFGLVILEAMQCKVPDVCSDFGGMKEIIKDGQTGLIFKSNDSKDLSNAINNLITNPSLRKKIIKNATLKVQKHFSTSPMIQKYKNLIN